MKKIITSFTEKLKQVQFAIAMIVIFVLFAFQSKAQLVDGNTYLFVPNYCPGFAISTDADNVSGASAKCSMKYASFSDATEQWVAHQSGAYWYFSPVSTPANRLYCDGSNYYPNSGAVTTDYSLWSVTTSGGFYILTNKTRATHLRVWTDGCKNQYPLSMTDAGNTDGNWTFICATPTLSPTSNPISTGVLYSWNFTAGALTSGATANTLTKKNGTNASPSIPDRFGASGNAFSYNSVATTYAQWMSSATNSTLAAPLSVSVWFKTTSTAGGPLIAFINNQSTVTPGAVATDAGLVIDNAGKVYTQINYNNLTTTAAYNDGRWHHAMITVGSSYGTNLYVDGKLEANTANTSTQSFTGWWRLANISSANWGSGHTYTALFNGSLDEVYI